MENGIWKYNGSKKTPLEIYENHVKAEKKILGKWKIIAIICISGFMLSLIVMAYAINLPKTVPVLITMNDFGETRVVGEINRLNYSGLKVPEIAIEARIRNFVINYFTIPADSEVLRQNLVYCYSCLTGASANKLSEHIKDNNPFEDFGNKKRSVKVESVLSLSKRSYQIDFIVVTSSPSEIYRQEQYMRGVITWDLLEPDDDDKLLNPLGIYFKDFDFTKVDK